MAQVVYAEQALEDLERVAGFLEPEGPEVVVAALGGIIEAIALLARHPLIGCRVEHGLRELVISRGKTGYVALYDFLEGDEVVLVLALRHQRELWGR